MRNRQGIGAAIAEMRRATNITQEVAADRAGISRPSLANIEAGRQGLLIETLANIARGLGTTASALLGEEPAGRGLAFEVVSRIAGHQREVTKLLAEAGDVVHRLAEASERMERTLSELATVDTRPNSGGAPC